MLYFKFACAYFSSYTSSASPYFTAADIIDCARALFKLPLLSFVESQLNSDFINVSYIRKNTLQLPDELSKIINRLVSL